MHYGATQGVAQTQMAVPLLAFWREGHSGVAFFCTISGFILYWLYSEKQVSYTQFIKRRALRIAPLFLFVTFLAFLLDRTWTTGQLLGALTTIHIGSLVGIAGQGWSVLVEMQFYLLFPILLLFSKRYGLSYFMLLIVLFVALRWLVWVDKGTVRDLAYLTLYGRADQFLAGMLTAAAVKRFSQKQYNMPLAWAGFVTGAAIVVFACRDLYEKGGFFGTIGGELWVFQPTLEAIGYSLVIAGYVLASKGQAAGKISTFLSYLGRISFSMYMIHVLVYAALAKLPLSPTTWEQSVAMFFVIAFPAVILASMATYELIERPFLELRKDERPARAAGPTLVTYDGINTAESPIKLRT